MGFEIIIGKKNLTSEVNHIVNPENWDKCKWRSDIEKFFVVKCCGGGQCEVEGYVCKKLGTLSLQPVICERCSACEFKDNH